MWGFGLPIQTTNNPSGLGRQSGSHCILAMSTVRSDLINVRIVAARDFLVVNLETGHRVEIKADAAA